MAKILITGIGLTSSALGESLHKKGFEVQYLTRNPNRNARFKCYKWDILKEEIDLNAFKNVNTIIHLTGAGISNKKWSTQRKKEIFDSRIRSTLLLYNTIKSNNFPIQSIIATSAIGFYGTSPKDVLFKETDSSSKGFLGKTCASWEKEILKFQELNIPTTILRTGVVFSNKGGALLKIIKPIKLNMGAILGKGNQIIPWIHIKDLCSLYHWILDNQNKTGIFNAVAPSYNSNKELTSIISKKLNKTLWLPNIPSWTLKLFFGEMSSIFLLGNRISSNKLKESGFKFKYDSIEKALNDLLKN